MKWGGILLRNLEYLQPIAAACNDPIAYEMEAKRKFRTNIEALCNVHARREGWLEEIPEAAQDLGSSQELLKSVASGYTNKNSLKAANFAAKKAKNEVEFCRAVSEEFKEVFDILKTAIFNNPEICNKGKLRREYKARFPEDHYE